MLWSSFSDEGYVLWRWYFIHFIDEQFIHFTAGFNIISDIKETLFLPNLKQEILLCSLPINKFEVLIPNAFSDLSLFNREFCHQLNMRFDTYNLEIWRSPY